MRYAKLIPLLALAALAACGDTDERPDPQDVCETYCAWERECSASWAIGCIPDCLEYLDTEPCGPYAAEAYLCWSRTECLELGVMFACIPANVPSECWELDGGL